MHKAAKSRSKVSEGEITSEQKEPYERTIERQTDGRKKLEEKVKSLREINEELAAESEQSFQKLETPLLPKFEVTIVN